MEKKVVVATKKVQIADVINKIDGFAVLTTLQSKDKILSTCKSLSPDILVITEGVPSSNERLSTVNFLLAFHRELPDVRIIFLSGEVSLDNIARVTELGSLVSDGIYDIYHQRQLSKSILSELLKIPKRKQDVEYLLQYQMETTSYDDLDLDDEYIEENDDDEGLDKENVFVVSSIKPGTGKSFVATNLSAAIAKFGVLRKDGRQPRVALIEGDLQNLSVGTLLQIENDKVNIKTALDKIATIVSDDGTIIGTKQECEAVNQYLIKCFQPYSRARNLYALVGSQIRMEDMENVSAYHYYYLIDIVSSYFDVVIIDSNSSLQHVTTLPILQLAKTCYYIINLDFNNVRNNARYRETLNNLGLSPKLKYILNEDISKNSDKYAERLEFDSNTLNDSGFELESKIPVIDKSIFLNRLYAGVPVVFDKSEHTLEAREAICTVANQIWELGNIDDLRMEKEMIKRSSNKTKNKKKFSFFNKK